MISAKEANKIANKIIEDEIKNDTELLIKFCETEVESRANRGHKKIDIKVSSYREEVKTNVRDYFESFGYKTYINCGYLVIIWEDEEV